MKIFCDMDGVLCCFTGAAYQLHGFTRPKGHPLCYDFWREMGMTAEQFWKPFKDGEAGIDWWANLKPCPWFSELVVVLDDFGNWDLLSKTTSPEAAHGKLLWAEKYFDNKHLHLSPNKGILGKEGSVLIDDDPTNIHNWQKAGGYGILFPATHNFLRAEVDDPVSYVERQLEKYYEWDQGN